ncbi:MAG: short-chain dehydrogenase [Gammaproteobacteria bacterium]|nr:short-chain dehydrogenase [Gammaproteobacteria bacterium]
MTGSLEAPPRTDTVPETRLPLLPPLARSRVALALTAAAALGRFELQVCRDCGTVQYPPREACHRCLSAKLDWKLQSGEGELISATTLYHSHSEFFRVRLPWRLGMVRLDSGPTVIAHLSGNVPAAPTRVRVGVRLDRAGLAALIAFPPEATSTIASTTMTSIVEDKVLREMTSDPKLRKALVTDGKTAVGVALARACVAAGAATVWVGHAGSSKTAALEELGGLERVTLLPLDLTSPESVEKAAAEIGTQVDIVINNAEFHGTQGDGVSHGAVGTHGVAGLHGVGTAHAEMDVNYFGLLRLAQELGAAMRSRAANSASGVLAWVNLLSIYALTSLPGHDTFCASKAAAYSLSQCLRAELQPVGIRVVNVFPGPVDAGWSQGLSLPRISPDALARAIVKALQDGVEDVYPGDVAAEWLARWRDNPKVLERELAMSRSGG